jgi:hypothetical protein
MLESTVTYARPETRVANRTHPVFDPQRPQPRNLNGLLVSPESSPKDALLNTGETFVTGCTDAYGVFDAASNGSPGSSSKFAAAGAAEARVIRAVAARISRTGRAITPP